MHEVGCYRKLPEGFSAGEMSCYGICVVDLHCYGTGKWGSLANKDDTIHLWGLKVCLVAVHGTQDFTINIFARWTNNSSYDALLLFLHCSPILNQQTHGCTQARAASAFRCSILFCNKNAISVAWKGGARQIPPRSLFLVSQSRNTARVPRPPRKACNKKKTGVAGGRARGGAPQVRHAYDRGHKGVHNKRLL